MIIMKVNTLIYLFIVHKLFTIQCGNLSSLSGKQNDPANVNETAPVDTETLSNLSSTGISTSLEPPTVGDDLRVLPLQKTVLNVPPITAINPFLIPVSFPQSPEEIDPLPIESTGETTPKGGDNAGEIATTPLPSTISDNDLTTENTEEAMLEVFYHDLFTDDNKNIPTTISYNDSTFENTGENTSEVPFQNDSTIETTEENRTEMITQDGFDPYFCPFKYDDYYQWDSVRVNETVEMNCPNNATGIAKHKCISRNGLAVWDPSPDLSGCISPWLTALEKTLNHSNINIDVSSELLNYSNGTLFAGDLLKISEIIKNMTESMGSLIKKNSKADENEEKLKKLLQNVVKTESNLLDQTQMKSWTDLNYTEQIKVSTSLVSNLEDNAFLFAEIQRQDKPFVYEVENILIDVRTLKINSNDSNEVFLSELDGKDWTNTNNRIELSKQSLLENSDENGIVRIVMMAFDHLEEVLQPNDEDRQQNNNSYKVINSKIISASLGSRRHFNLSQPVKIYFNHLITENVSHPSCVYWDYNERNWSPAGCRVIKTNKTHTACECDHLTNFAVLMDVNAIKIDKINQFALEIITYFGCTVSIICFVLAILIFQCTPALKFDERTIIHKNLCICLLIAEVVFLCGIDQTEQRLICGIVAGLLHFYFLCAFGWMFLEGYHLYEKLIEIFEAKTSRLGWYYAGAYGIPLLIVVISAIVDPWSYGTDQYCWLRTDNYFIYSFVGPVALVILANSVFLTMAICVMFRHTNSSVFRRHTKKSRSDNKTWIRGTIILVFLLGLTWVFGFLYINKKTLIMAYIFTTLNSFQGLFIFVFYCVQNEKVRNAYKKFSRENSWLPRYMRCSVRYSRRGSYSPNHSRHGAATSSSDNNTDSSKILVTNSDSSNKNKNNLPATNDINLLKYNVNTSRQSQ